MSAEIINLRRARKERARIEREQKAKENRRLFGLDKAERQRQAKEEDRQSRTFDGHEIKPPRPDDE